MANYTVKNETVSGYHVSSGVSVLFCSDGIASKCTVSSGGWLAVGVRGAADSTTVSNGGYMSFGSGSYLCSGVSVKSGGTMAIGCNTQIKNAVADNGAVLHLTMAGEWFNRPSIYELTSNGVSITSTTKTSTTDIGIVVRGFTGWDMKTPGCSLLITDWASAAFVKVSSGCALTLGSAAPYGPGCAGQIDVYNGGTAWLDKANGVGLATVHSGGTMYLTDVENATIMENGGYLKIYDERIFHADEYYDPNVKIKPNTFSKVVLSGTSGKYAQATAHSGTTAVSTTIGNSGWMEIFDGGKATDTVVSSGGVLHVFSGAVVRNVNLATGGDVFVSSGGKVTGNVKLDGRLFCEEGAILDFDISGLSPNNAVLVTNCSNIATYGIYPTFSLTVSGSQAKGTYKLAANAYLFGNVNKEEKEKPLVICDTSGARIGSVISGRKTMVNGQTYALHLSGGDLTITVAAYVDGEDIWYEQFGCADDGWNDYLVDKSKDLNPNAAKFVTTTVTASTTDILLDTKNTVSKNGKKNYVGGGGDAVDFARITMKNAAKLSLTVTATDAAKFTLWRLIPGKGDSYTMKSVQTATLKKNKLTGEYEATTNVLMVYEGEEFYVSVESTNAKKGGEAFYNVQVNKDESAFFTKGDNSDDWEDMKWNGADGDVGSCKTDSSTYLVTSGWVGFGDEIDYKSFKINSAAKLLLWVEASDEAEFALYQLNEPDRKGNYSLKKIESAKLSKNKQYTPTNDEPKYYKVFQPVLLTAGTYYLSVKSTNAAKGGSADYEVYYNGTVFFSKGDSSDDWDDLAEKGAAGKVGANIDLNPDMYTVTQNWVGYGDAVDYKKITLTCPTKLSLYVYSFDNMKFSLCALNEPDKKGNYSLKTLQSVSLKMGKWDIDCDATTKPILLEAGVYYIRMESTNAAKGGNANYEVTMNEHENVFYVYADGGENNILCDRKTKKLDPHAGSFVSTALTASTTYVSLDKKNSVDIGGWKNFVGYSDDTDYAKITLAKDATVRFGLEAMDAAKFTIWQLVPGKGDTYTQKSLQSTALKKDKKDETYTATTKTISLAAGTYYVSMESTNAAKGGNAYYNVWLDSFALDNKNAAMLTGGETEALSDGFADVSGVVLPDALNAGLNGPEDHLSAAGLASVADALSIGGDGSAWPDLATLA